MSDATISLDETLSLLSELKMFAHLGSDELRDLARRLRPVSASVGEAVVTECETADALYVIVSGTAEVTTKRNDKPLVLALLHAGELFGELGLVREDERRTATITATEELRLLTLSREDFLSFHDTNVGLQSALKTVADELMVTKFLKQASPFAHLTPSQSKALTARLRHLEVDAGTEIITQGDSGDACYLLREGAAVVTHSDPQRSDGVPRELASLGVGALFGEAALLIDARRNATVTATEPCKLLVLHRPDLLEILRADAGLSRPLFEQMQVRARPKAKATVVVHERRTPEGELIRTLKDTEGTGYFRLTKEGWFIWQRLDGNHTIKDLTLAYFKAFKKFAPQTVVELVVRLAAGGFIEGKVCEDIARAALDSLTFGQRLLFRLRSLATWRRSFRNAEGLFVALYQRGGKLLFTRTARALMLSVALIGLVAFALSIDRAIETFGEITPAILALFYPAYAVSIALHEAAHGLTVIHYGRDVRGAGIGWYWFGPIAYVDTSDMWLASRGQRIRVSLAGPCANMVLAGFVALMALPWSGALEIFLWQVALVNYASALFNMNPLLEYDGYHILSDWLDRPNFRREALAWLRRNFSRSFRDPALRRAHRAELLYGVSSVGYIALMVAFTVIVARVVLAERLSVLVSPTFATAVSWTLGLVIAAMGIAALIVELRSSKDPSAV